MIYRCMTVQELQKLGGDDLAMAELGRRLCDVEIHRHHFNFNSSGAYYICLDADRLYEEIDELENMMELPSDYEQVFDAGVKVGLADAICLNT